MMLQHLLMRHSPHLLHLRATIPRWVLQPRRYLMDQLSQLSICLALRTLFFQATHRLGLLVDDWLAVQTKKLSIYLNASLHYRTQASWLLLLFYELVLDAWPFGTSTLIAMLSAAKKVEVCCAQSGNYKQHAALHFP